MMTPGRKFYRRPSLVTVAAATLLALLIVPTALVLTARAQTETVDETQQTSYQSLHEAAKAGDLEQVKTLIAEGAKVNGGTGRWNWAPLHIAARYGHDEICEQLIVNGADINARAIPGQTPLLYAAQHGHPGVVRLLVDKGADINAPCGLEGTPLYGAVVGGHEDLAEWLMSKGADANAALLCAAEFGHMGAAKLLLDNGASIHAKDGEGLTPLHRAASRCHTQMAEWLIDRGADVNAKDSSGATPAYTAVGLGMLFGQERVVDMVKLLLTRGAQVNIHLAAFCGDMERVESFLNQGVHVDLKVVARINQRNNVMTPLCMAAIAGQKQIVQFLIDQGADVNARVDMTHPESTSGPLSVALMYRDYEVVKALVDNGADVKASGMFGSPLWTLLLAAAARGAEVFQGTGLDIGFSNEEFHLAMGKLDARAAEYSQKTWPHLRSIVGVLLAQGVSVNEKSLGGSTLMHYAAELGLKEAAAVFIAHGADVNAEDDEGKTPIDVAKEEGHAEIADLLRRHGARE